MEYKFIGTLINLSFTAGSQTDCPTSFSIILSKCADSHRVFLKTSQKIKDYVHS